MARDSPLGTSPEQAAELGEQAGVAHGRAEAVRVRIDPAAVSRYADDLGRRASAIEKRRDELKGCGIWMLDAAELPGVAGMVKAVDASLASAARALKRSRRRTIGLALAYQELERSYPGGGVPRAHWREHAGRLRPRDLDASYRSLQRMADQLGDRRGTGRAQQARTAHSALDLLRIHSQLLQVRDDMTIGLMNKRLASASNKMQRMRLLEDWLGVDRPTSRLIAKSYEKGKFASVYDVMLYVDGRGRRLPAETMNDIFSRIRSGDVLARLPFRAEEVMRFMSTDRLVAMAGSTRVGAIGSVRFSAAYLDRLRQRLAQRVAVRVGGRVLIGAGVVLDGATLLDPDATRLSKASATMGIGGTVMVVGGGVAATGFGAPVGGTIAVVGAVVGVGSLAVTGVDAWWSNRTEEEKLEAYAAAAEDAAPAAFEEQLRADAEAAWAEIEATRTPRPAGPRSHRVPPAGRERMARVVAR